MNAYRLLLLGCAALMGAACGGEPDPLAACRTEAGFDEPCLTAHYFRGYQPLAQPSCAETAAAASLQGRLHLALHAGDNVVDAEVVSEGQRLQRYFEPYGLSFYTRSPAQATQLRYAMNGSPQEIDEALRGAGFSADQELVGAELERARKVIGGVVFRELRDFVVGASVPGARLVNMVVLRNVVAPALAMDLFGLEMVVVGLGLSPTLLNQLEQVDAEGALYAMFGLPADFTPAFFIGHADLYLVPNADNVVAHEMGHALGLPHTLASENVMSTNANPACVQLLSAEQIALLRDDVEMLAQARREPPALTTLVDQLIARSRARRAAR